MTTLADLQAMPGVFVGQAVEREIEFSIDGKDYKAVIFVKPMSVANQERIVLGSDAEDGERGAKTISELVLLGDGTERLPFGEALKLHPAIAKAMMLAIAEVNGKAKK